MTLKQAFTLWANIPRNLVLATRSRDAVQRVLMKKYSDIDLEQITQGFAERLFSQCSEAQELKTKAASILVYLLQWGGDNGYCQRPTFDYTIATSEVQPSDTVGTAPAVAKGEDDSTEGLSPSVSPAPESGQQSEELTKPEEIMEPKKERKPAGRKARPLAQIHPDTLEVVKVWPSLSEAERETGACNLDRVITLLRKSVGFYWCNAEDADTFKARLDEKKQKTAERKQARPQVKASAQPKPKKESSTESTQGTVPAVTSVSPVGEHAASHQGQSPCAPANAASKALAVFTDDELLAELDRRGWQGELRRMMVVAIGV